MKKLTSFLMAAVMTASIGLTSAFAASTNAQFELRFGGVKLETIVDDATVNGKTLAPGAASMTLTMDNGTAFTFKNIKTLNPGAQSSTVADAFAGGRAEARHDGILYTLELSSRVLDSGTNNVLNATVYPVGKIPFNLSSVSFGPSPAVTGNTSLEFKVASLTPRTISLGTGGANDNGNQTIDIGQVLYTDSNGRAIPLVEDREDLNDTGDGVRSGTDVYFLVNAPFDNDTYFKLRASKGSNSKNIGKIDVVSKYFTKELYKVYGGQQLSGGLTTGRHLFIKVPLKELYTDDEYKITFDLKVSLTSKGEDKYPNYRETSIKADNVTAIWLKNSVDKGDGDYRVGETGMMIKPLANDWNEIVWYNEQDDLARLSFFADSDVKAFYSKLSTKWNHQDYASYFNDQDAFIFDFTGSPSLSSTSRADLEIYNPFVNYNGDETINPRDAIIYQVIDGDLYDITDSWSYGEGDNGNMAFKTRTRFLGTYIFCEKPVLDDNVVDELPPDNSRPPVIDDKLPNDKPVDKKPPNTGRYA